MRAVTPVIVRSAVPADIPQLLALVRLDKALTGAY
jgi:hypothetical protein